MTESLDSANGYDPLHPGFVAWTGWILRHRSLTLLGVLLVTAWFVREIGVRGLVLDNRPEVFASEDSDSTEALAELRDEFGRDDLFIVVLEGDVFSLPFLEKLKKLHDALAIIDIEKAETAPAAEPAAEPAAAGETDDFGDDGGWGEADDGGWGDEAGGTIIDEVSSLINARETRPSPDGIVVGTLFDTWPAASELGAIKARVLAHDQWVGRLIGSEGRHTTISVRTELMSEVDTTKVLRKIEALCEQHRSEDFKLWVAGTPALATVLNELTLLDTARMMTLATLVVTVVMLLIFRHILGLAGAIVVVLLANLWTFGLMAILGYAVTLITTILPAFVVIVSIGDTVHLQSVYRDVRKGGADNSDAIIHALGVTGMPMLYTTLTTAVGLFSFQFASLKAVNELGLVGAFGVCGAFFVTITVIPVVLSWNKKSLLGARDAQTGFDLLDAILVFCNRLSGTFKSPFTGAETTDAQRSGRLRNSLVVGALLIGFGVWALSLLTVKHDPLSFLPHTTQVRQGFDLMDEKIGGTAMLAVLIEPKSELGIRDLELLKRLEKVEEFVLNFKRPGDAMPLATNSMSILDVVRETNRALHGGDSAYYRLPDTQRGLSDVLFLFENAGPDQLRRLATNDLSKSQMTFTLHWLPANEYEGLAASLQQQFVDVMGDHANLRLTGIVYSMLSTIGALVRDLLRSFGFAFTVITVIMILLFKDLKLGLIAMIPNLTPILWLLATMSLLGIPLDSVNLMIGSVAIGLCVDDTIHFLHHFQIHYAESKDTDLAIKESLKHAGRAIVITSLILMTGLGVYVGATIASLTQFGLLVALTIAYALIADLILGPAVLRMAYGATPPK